MADDDKLEFRDVSEEDGERYLTRPTSQTDLDTRLSDDYKPEADVSGRTFVNPNPFGEEEYAGTDPIYQNHANDTEKPYAAEEGPDMKAEEAVKELFEADDDAVVVPDHGLGGEAVKAASQTVDVERRLVPGQEGYPDDVPSGPAVAASSVKSDDEGETSEEATDKQEAGVPSTQPPASPAAPAVEGVGSPQSGNQ